MAAVFAACMIAALEACTQRKVDPIVGKPSKIMLREALGVLGLEAGDCAMVGDRPDTDMRMAAGAGLTGVLVLTGVGTREDADAITPRPIVIDSIAEIADVL